ncbi:MAG: hypothetical protein KDD64_07270 [Bdellovibrionales bacterium]|nr:hypothetical protein [Bdellovibrionales bacterium]
MFERIFALQGALALFVAFIGGIFFARAIVRGQREVAWRVVHSGGAVAGVMLIALGWVVHLLVLPSWALTLFAFLISSATWAFIVGMVIAAVTGERGLRGGGASINRVVYALYMVGTAGSLVSFIPLIFGLISGF